MKLNKTLTGLSLIAVGALVSCGDRVEVPTAHVGFVKTKTGLEKEVKKPSTFRLPYSWSTPPDLILVETSNFAKKEPITLMMPKDNLNFTFDVRGIYSISEQDAFDIVSKVTAMSIDQDNVTYKVDSTRVYDTYVSQVVRTQARTVVSQYSIKQVLENQQEVSGEIRKQVETELQGSPIKMIRLDIAGAQPPAVIVEAQESAHERKIEIENAKSDKLVALTVAESDLEVARKQQAVDLLKAETRVLVDRKLAEVVDSRYITLQALEVLEALAKSDNKVFILSQEAISNPSILVGVTQDGLKNKDSTK